MNLKKLSATVTVSDQILPSDLEEIAALGFRSIVCNRPDGESSDQPAFAEISAEARLHALEARYLPIRNRQIDNNDAVSFAELHGELAKPIFVYCKSGARSIALWQSSQRQFAAPQRSRDEHSRYAPV